MDSSNEAENEALQGAVVHSVKFIGQQEDLVSDYWLISVFSLCNTFCKHKLSVSGFD